MIISVLAVFAYFYPDKIMAKNAERSFIMVKPDGVQRGLISDIMKRFEQKGFKLVAAKIMKVRTSLSFIFFFDNEISHCSLFGFCV